MKLLDKLRAIGIDLSSLKGLNLFKLSITIDKSVHIDARNATVTVNPDLLPGKQRRSLERLLREDGLEDAGAIIHERHLPLVDDVQETLPAMQADLSFFVPILPPQDVPLLQACLYLRQQFRAGKPVDGLKVQIVRVYGQRGRNFANLCSAEYLDSWFRPVYEEIVSAYPDNPSHAREKFIEFYNVILRDLPWTEFVCNRVSVHDLTASATSKIRQNQQNGVRFLNLHGLGADNGKKILAVLPEIKRQTGAVSVKIEQDGARTFVRLEIPEPV